MRGDAFTILLSLGAGVVAGGFSVGFFEDTGAGEALELADGEGGGGAAVVDADGLAVGFLGVAFAVVDGTGAAVVDAFGSGSAASITARATTSNTATLFHIFILLLCFFVVIY